MTAQRTHRCGGTLRQRSVQVRREIQATGAVGVLVYIVPGLVCDNCQEELVEPQAVLEFEKSQTPTVVWAEPAVSPSDESIFGERDRVAGTALVG
jgi:hypothetical protein